MSIRLFFIAMFALCLGACAQEQMTTARATPAPVSKGAYFMVPAGTRNVPPGNSPIRAHTAGIYFGVPWAAVEPGGKTQAACAANPAPADCFDWTDTIDPILALLPPGKTAQVEIGV